MIAIKLNDRNAFVCGASMGIGKSIALTFAEAGANVTLLARNESRLLDTVEYLRNTFNGRYDYICSDICDFDFIRQELNKRISENGPYHILVNNTGGPAPGKLFETEATELVQAFNQHVISAQNITKYLVADMIKMRFGRIINIISIGLKQPIVNLGVSNTVRGAMGSWSKTLSSELAGYGITVNNILPGYTNTERLQYLIEKRSKNENKSIDEITEEILGEIPAARLGEPTEVAYISTFLASELASYINGINLPVDGGYLRTL